MKSKWVNSLGLATALLCGAQLVHAAEWSDNSIGYRYGRNFAEPFVGTGIGKNIFNFTHVSGYKYGTNFLNIDLLQSSAKNTSAQEAYVVYRNTLDFGKISGKSLQFGPVRSLGATVGIDWNTKTGDSYGSRKRMFVFGPTVMFDVPGFLNASLLIKRESNHPKFIENRYSYKTHPMLSLTWGIPLGSSKFSFEGYANYSASKGKNETGGPTSPELDLSPMVMYDASELVGLTPKKLRVGLAYQYWHNKFGNPSNVPGSEAKTTMIRAEYHF